MTLCFYDPVFILLVLLHDTVSMLSIDPLSVFSFSSSLLFFSCFDPLFIYFFCLQFLHQPSFTHWHAHTVDHTPTAEPLRVVTEDTCLFHYLVPAPMSPSNKSVGSETGSQDSGDGNAGPRCVCVPCSIVYAGISILFVCVKGHLHACMRSVLYVCYSNSSWSPLCRLLPAAVLPF